MTRLLAHSGTAELQAGIAEALERDEPHPNAARLALERRRELRDRLPPYAMNLRAQDVAVRARNLQALGRYPSIESSTFCIARGLTVFRGLDVSSMAHEWHHHCYAQIPAVVLFLW
jgi:hypothetical protein